MNISNIEEEELIAHCKTFVQKADDLELKGFKDTNYQENQFEEDFNSLFNQYAYGKQNRTISGLNFRNPPRYENIKFAVNTTVEQTSKTKCQVTFWGNPEHRSIRFILTKNENEWRLLRFETFLSISK